MAETAEPTRPDGRERKDHVTDFVFETALVPAPLTLEEYRRTYLPRPGLRNTGTFVSAYLTGASGRRYHGQRAFDDHTVGKSRTLSFCRLLDGDRTQRPPELWETPRFAQRHEYEYEEGADELRFANEHCDVRIREDGWTWRDGSGRWDLTATLLGDRPYYFWVPPQEHTPICQYHRGQMVRLRGEVEGEEVRGYGYLDYSWGPDNLTFQFYELPLIRRMNKAWLSWFAEFEDGGYITGAARKGRAGVSWSMAYVVIDGEAKVCTPTTTELTYDENRIIRRAVLDTGHETIEFEQDCSTYYPLHTIGGIVRTSLDRPIGDTWTNVEWMPDNAEELFAAVNQGRVGAAGWQALRIEGERAVVPGMVE